MTIANAIRVAGLVFVCACWRGSGDTEAAVEALNAVIDEAISIDQDFFAVDASVHLADALNRSGDPLRALEVADRAHDIARTIIRENRAKLDQLAHKLLEVETLEGDALIALMESPTDDDGSAGIPAAPPPPPAPSPPPVEPDKRDEEEETPRPRPRPGLAWGS